MAGSDMVRVVTRYMRSGITAPGSGITTLGIGISSVLVESGIKIVNVFVISDQNLGQKYRISYEKIYLVTTLNGYRMGEGLQGLPNGK